MVLVSGYLILMQFFDSDRQNRGLDQWSKIAACPAGLNHYD